REVADDLEAVCLRDALHGAADFVDASSVARLRDRLAQRDPRGMTQPVLQRIRRRHDPRAACVGEIAFEDGGHVDVHDVSRLDDAVTRYAVRRLLVDADARRAGEVVDDLRRGPRTMPLEQAAADVIELGCRHAGLDRIEHAFEYGRNNFADGLEAFDVTLRL